MHIEILDEPELEFGGTQRHLDPRFGIAAYGPADLGHDGTPTAIRLGLVGPRGQLDGIRRWIDRCRSPIDAIDDKYPHLFPGFPGCDSNTGLCTTLTIATATAVSCLAASWSAPADCPASWPSRRWLTCT